MYHRVQVLHEEEPVVYSDAKGPNHFTDERYLRLLQLRQNALREARNQWADYLMVSLYFSIFPNQAKLRNQIILFFFFYLTILSFFDYLQLSL